MIKRNIDNNVIIQSWGSRVGLKPTNQILDWINYKIESTKVNIIKIPIFSDGVWFLDDKGFIRNNNLSFFQIAGIRQKSSTKCVEQPIILQNEIGFLGIITKIINHQLLFLMQAKIEPGNVNVIQISPTIQATKSNFTQIHGGRKPHYLEYFTNVKNDNIIVDQIQSEQGSKFLGKRNRNMIVYVDDEIDVLDSYMWMSLGQIKEFMKIPNLVNMDTRTVISCIPIDEDKDFESDNFVLNSLIKPSDCSISLLFNRINKYKMFQQSSRELIPIKALSNWDFINGELVSQKGNFKVIYAKIQIEGREVENWTQPLLEATSIGLFGLFMYKNNSTKKVEVLVSFKTEIGTFDTVELGPSVQVETNNTEIDSVHKVFDRYLKNNKNITYDVLLSEEGGRFYHEQNRNVIIILDNKDEINLSDDYMWLDLRILNDLVQFNNIMNIQLRNLLSLLEI